MRGHSKTPSDSRTERAQTTQDFVIGIGIFLLAVAFVFSFLPSLLTPYAPAVDDGDVAQADRIAGEVLETVEGNETNEVNGSAFEGTYVGEGSNTLVGDLGLRSANGDAIDRVNVSIERLNQSQERSERTVLGGGDAYDGGSGVSSARIVSVDWEAGDGVDPANLNGVETEEDRAEVCDPACRLVVRIW